MWHVRYDRKRRLWTATSANPQSPFFDEELNAYTREELNWLLDHVDDPNNQDMLIKRVDT